MMEDPKIEYGEITVEKILRNLFIAKCEVLAPLKSSIEMKGKTEEITREKLELFLNNKPYSHLDK